MLLAFFLLSGDSMSKTYAMIAVGDIKVFNTIIADPDFTYDGYYFVEVLGDVFCQLGMYYNCDDGLFYDDEGFTTINEPELIQPRSRD